MKACNNPIFHENLQACFILHFDLLRFPQIDKPFAAMIELGIEPAEFLDFSKIFAGQPPGDREITGMVQVNSFQPFSRTEVAGMRAIKHEIWHVAKDSLLDDKKDTRCFQVGNGENRQTITAPMIIGTGGILESVRKSKPWKIACPNTGKVTEKPFNIENMLGVPEQLHPERHKRHKRRDACTYQHATLRHQDRPGCKSGFRWSGSEGLEG
ncbi:hypothetical protein C8R44DRAFT_880017 [Mycena epipterygia]|nr:hypothetical protein C8R44DRAFT_880017 [Mycena epipterygia]